MERVPLEVHDLEQCILPDHLLEEICPRLRGQIGISNLSDVLAHLLPLLPRFDQNVGYYLETTVLKLAYQSILLRNREKLELAVIFSLGLDLLLLSKIICSDHAPELLLQLHRS